MESFRICQIRKSEKRPVQNTVSVYQYDFAHNQLPLCKSHHLLLSFLSIRSNIQHLIMTFFFDIFNT